MYVPVLGDVSDILLLLLLLVGAFYLYCASITGVWEKAGVPGPKPWPILYHLGELKNGPDPALDKWEKEYGRTYGVYNLHTRSATLVTTDVKLLNKILVTDFSSFADREFMKFSSSTANDGLFFQNGSTWKRNRHVMSPMFTVGKLRIILNHVNDSAENFTKFIEQNKKNEKLLPIKEFSARYTSDVIGKTGFGVDTESLTDENGYFFYNIKNYVALGKPLFVLFYFLSFYFPFMMTIGLTLFPNMVDPIAPKIEDYFAGMAKSVIAAKKKEKQHSSDSGGKSKYAMDMMDLMLEAEAKDTTDLTSGDDTLSMRDIIGNSSVLILAGYETNAAVLQTLLFSLASNPDIQDKLIEEIDMVVGKNLPPDYDTLKLLKYMDQVINETLRLFPPSPTIARKCLESKTYGTMTIPKGSNVFIPIYRIHRDPDYWPQPDKFDPERFSPENKTQHDPAAFIPFGLGPRQCVAKLLALMELKSALCHVLSKMKFVLTENTQPKKDQELKQCLHFGFFRPDKPIQLDVVFRDII